MSSTPPTPSDESMVSRVLAEGFGKLKFPEPLEREFRHDHLLAQRRWVRMSLFIVVGTSTCFALIDHLVLRAASAVPDIARFGLQLDPNDEIAQTNRKELADRLSTFRDRR
jgi:hypothetical protein